MIEYKVIKLTNIVRRILYIRLDREDMMKTHLNRVTIGQSFLRFLLLIRLMTLSVFIYSTLYTSFWSAVLLTLND